jgi:hypothetical protein
MSRTTQEESQSIPLRTRIENAVDNALSTSMTIDGREYASFVQLDGVCRSQEFIERVKLLLILYVDILVFQDEWRAKGRSERAIPPSSSSAEPFVNYFSIKRDLILLNHVASKIIVELHPEVRNAYLSGTNHWKEGLLGCLISIALVSKAAVSGVQKVSRAEVKEGLDSDVPFQSELSEAAIHYLKSCPVKTETLEGPSTNCENLPEQMMAAWAEGILQKIMKIGQKSKSDGTPF